LSGKVPNGAASILLAEVGGATGQVTVTAVDDPVVQPGEEYVFFLLRDERPALPNTSGMPRYAVLGAWAGKVRVAGGKISFLPAASPYLHEYDNTELNAFVRLVKNTADEVIAPVAALPIHPPQPGK
jgi:hypothetical protein